MALFIVKNAERKQRDLITNAFAMSTIVRNVIRENFQGMKAVIQVVVCFALDVLAVMSAAPALKGRPGCVRTGWKACATALFQP